MEIAWLFIGLSSGASVLVAHLLRVIEHRKLDTVRVLTINYLAATLVAFTTAGWNDLVGLDWVNTTQALGLAGMVGILFIVNFFIYSKSVFHNGVGISVAAMRISLIIPVLLSVFWYFELLTYMQWLGVLLVFVTLFLLLPDKKNLFRTPYNSAWLLVLLFICTGIGDASLKMYEVEFSRIIEKEQFMGFVFFAAFLVGIVVIFFQRKGTFTIREVGLGIALGIPNLYTSVFLIEALERMNGAVVYSSVNVLTVLGGTVLGLMRWGDKLTRNQWIGLLLTLFAIFLFM